jgi:hypothetical protein
VKGGQTGKKQRNKDTKYKRIHEEGKTKKSRNIKEKTKLKLNQNGSKWKGRGIRWGNPFARIYDIHDDEGWWWCPGHISNTPPSTPSVACHCASSGALAHNLLGK